MVKINVYFPKYPKKKSGYFEIIRRVYFVRWGERTNQKNK